MPSSSITVATPILALRLPPQNRARPGRYGFAVSVS